jgi:hypothetical protein
MGEKQSGDGTGEVPDRDVVTGMVEVSISLRNGVSVSLETTKASELVKALAVRDAELYKAQDESIRYRHAFAALCAVLDVPSWPLDWARIREQVEARFREKDARSGDAWRLGIEAGHVEAAERLRRAYEGCPDLPGTCAPLESLRLKLIEARVEIDRLRVVAEAARRVNVEYEKDFPMRSVPLLRGALAALDAAPDDVNTATEGATTRVVEPDRTTIVQRCTSTRVDDDMNNVPCAAYLDDRGEVHDGCGEPCSWVMRKSGHGDPPWRSGAEEEAAATERAAIVVWLREQAAIFDKYRRADESIVASTAADRIEYGDHTRPVAADERGRKP